MVPNITAETLNEYVRSRKLLLCDCCGKVHLDNEAALVESCDCGRFKQRMEWLTEQDIKRSWTKAAALAALEIEAARAAKEVSSE